MKVFISYARVDKPVCVQIAEHLNIHDVWYDQRLYAGQDWWQEILRRLDWCDVFIYLMSPDSLQSEYCIKEFRIAVSTGKAIIPVLIHPNTRIPERLAHLQYVDFSHGITTDGLRMLLNAIHLTERKLGVKTPGAANKQPDGEVMRSPVNGDSVDPAEIMNKAASALQQGKYDVAIMLLRQGKELGYISRFIDVDSMLKDAEQAMEIKTNTLRNQRDYQSIAVLFKHDLTRRYGCEALARFLEAVPGYDPENLARLCQEAAPSVSASVTAPVIKPEPARFHLPMLEWCDIPAGNLIVREVGPTGVLDPRSPRQTLWVDRFKLAKYPITNAQYQVFLEDPDGYCNPRWWSFSPYAIAWRQQNPGAAASRFKGDERPRENVTWYEAMAFCRWLSEKLNLPVRLPTKQQWRRAAQGDDARTFPWGEMFDKSLCNTRESGLRMTTLVMRYPEGASPFLVYDMAGNVWEWCYNSDWDDMDITTDRQRAVQGGSYFGTQERAQINFSFDLAPDYHYGSIGFRIACVE